MKKIFFLVFILSFFNLTTLFASNVNLYVNNKKLSFSDQGPEIIKSRLLVPVRGVYESVGATVNWDEVAKTVYIKYQNHEIKMFMTSKRYSVTDTNTGMNVFYDFEVVPQIVKNRVMIPLRAVTDGLGGTTNWDGKTRTAYVNFDDNPPDAFQSKELKFALGKYNLQMLMTPSEVRNILGIPQREVRAAGGDIFYTYNTDYNYYIFLGFKDNKLAYTISNSKNFSVGETKVSRDKFTVKNKNNGANAIYYYEDENNIISAIAISNNGFTGRNMPLSEIEMQIFDFTNGFRVARGLKALAYNADLSDVAREHSEDMAAKNYFSHTSQDGSTFDDRIRNAGITFSAAAENIAYGTNDPFKMVHMWLLSEGHRKNMMRNIDSLGVGGTLNGYYTQCFATLK